MLFAGRVQKLKAPDLLIRTLPLLPDDVNLVIVGGPSGDPAIIPSLQALANQLGLAGRVQFIGPVPPAELANWYRAADVVAVRFLQRNLWLGCRRGTGLRYPSGGRQSWWFA